MAETQSEHIDPEIRHIVDAARNVWVRRLIDQSRSNSLLFYRELKFGTLDLTAQTDLVARLLRGDALNLDSFIPRPESSVDKERPESNAQRKMRRALISIQRKALSNLEEKGIETLYLAMGMATWPASDGGRPYAAPVLLLPARIEARGRAGDDLRFSVAGEPQINPVLLHVLEESYSVRINASSMLNECSVEEESGHWRVDPERVSANVERAAVAVPEFKVNRHVVLANFQFAKMAMVEDIKKNGDAMASSSIIAAIAGHSTSRQKLAESAIDINPRELDERPASADYLVLDADSTQQRAIMVASKGQNCVLHGPPGTGKSQTIANLIAQSVADGRRILFVAEKRAALDAVIKRLSNPDVDLSHLVLDLHGASVSRKQVMARLADTLDQIRHALPTDGTEAVHREFDARRKQLNEHARRVNEIRQPTGLSVNRIIGKLLRLPTAAQSPVRLRGEMLAGLTTEAIDHVKQWILKGAANPTLLLGTAASPWNNAFITSGRAAQEAIDLAIKTAGNLWPKFESLLGQMIIRVGLPAPTTLDQTATILNLLDDIRQLREKYADEIFSLRPGELAEALKPATGSTIGKAWAFVSKKAFRCARKVLLSVRSSPAPVEALKQDALHAADVLQRWQSLGPSIPIPVTNDCQTEMMEAFRDLGNATKALSAITRPGGFNNMPLTELASRLRALAADQRTPYQLPTVHELRQQFIEAGMRSFIDDLRDNSVAIDNWAPRLEYIWLYSALEEVLSSDPGLASFNGRTHEQILADFIQLDRERIRLTAKRVRRVHGERAIEAMNQHFQQANLVRAEASKKSRHISLRQLLASAPDVLTRIAPCWVASPLSVSQLLDGSKRYFDVVVFDEASQILQEEAIPALSRAEQVVVAGDRHQLPPTTFFATVIEGEDDISEEDEESRSAFLTATAAIGGFESLLGTLEAFLPNWLLEWHYRSEDERLIAFSNTHIYSGRLLTFPSARGHEALRHVLVPHDPALAGQEESASREVDEVVQQVLTHATTRPEESLGVITMGIKHANRVQAALDRALEGRADLSDFFSLEREERFFVKNLETVQGDERDAIILSVGYGKNASGDLPHRFGPLTQDTGHRRLNVAITRAKRRMCVISSFSHEEIDLNRSGSRGVELLKAYLAYAASGGERLPETEHAGEIGLNPFEADVRDALDAHRVITRPQFGASHYRIDLVAMHPQKHGRPVLAIECDGASYHSSATARDRDRLRQSHLERLGWHFHRIWSTDWFYNREQEVERLVATYQEAVRRADLMDADAPSKSPSKGMTPELQPVLGRQRGPRPLLPVRDNIDNYSKGELRQMAEWIMSDGLLRTDEQLTRDIFEHLPFERMGGRIRERLMTVIRDIHLRRRA